jgi:hypothetical protein
MMVVCRVRFLRYFSRATYDRRFDWKTYFALPIRLLLLEDFAKVESDVLVGGGLVVVLL